LLHARAARVEGQRWIASRGLRRGASHPAHGIAVGRPFFSGDAFFRGCAGIRSNVAATVSALVRGPFRVLRRRSA
jgi:hypothetical protein